MSKNVLDGLKQQDVENLTTLIEKLEASPFNFLKLENEGVKIVIGKNGVTETAETPSESSNVTVLPQKQEPVQEVQHAEVAAALEEPVKEVQPVVEDENVVTVKAQTAGLYYAQSEPGAPPYVKVGDQVEEDTTIGLIEIMKVFSAINAGVKGEVTAIHVEDAQLVEYGQPLISIKVK